MPPAVPQPPTVPLPPALTAHPLRVDDYVAWALYDPEAGFFSTGGGAGRRGGDFVTSAEVGPTFGAVIARWLDGVWGSLGRPDPFEVFEVGAGRGALALAVRAASPACGAALAYTMVERSHALRAAQGDHLGVSPALRGAGIRPGGPTFHSAAELPDGPITGVVLANELLDNLPFRLARREGGRWREVFVVADAAGESLGTELADLDPAVGAELDRLVGNGSPDGAPAGAVGDGVTVPWQAEAQRWVSDVLGRLAAGRLLLFDYADTTAGLAARPMEEWLRTYRGHDRGGSWLAEPGSKDITVEVALDQLPPGATVSSQADWLQANGIEELVAAARRTWSERAAVGDLAAMRARSVPLEADALCDPAGLGAFKVLEWSSPNRV